MLRKQQFSMLVTLAVAGIGALTWRWLVFDPQWSPTGKPGARHPYIDVLDKRIEQQVKVVEAESLAESIGHLSIVDLYFWPGAPSSSVTRMYMPLDEQIGLEDVHSILSNRRFRKVLHELSREPPERAGQMVSEAIKRELIEYDRLYEAYVASCDLVTPPGNGTLHLNGPPLQISSPEDGSTVLAGSRLKILSLVLASATLQLHGSREAVRSVIERASAVYSQMRSLAKHTPFVAQGVVTAASLFNRQILYAAMVRLEMIRDPGSVEWTREAVGEFDARATPYDLHALAGVVPVDWGGAKLNAVFARGISDDVFMRSAEGALATRPFP